MKLRIRDNSIRLRLTKSEVNEFAEKGLVGSKTEFNNNNILIYMLKSSDLIKEIQANFDNGRIEVVVPKAIAENWTNTNEVGFSTESDTLRILVEKDFACLTERPNEDESDNFPHPQENEQKC